MRSKKWINRTSVLLAVIVALGIIASGCSSASARQVPAAVTAPEKTAAAVADLSGGAVQTITSKITANGYPEITVKKGVPVKWILQADASSLNGCNNRLVIPSLNIEKKLEAGDNIIEFTPTKDGTIAYSCWMGMITSRINVVSDDSAANSNDASTTNNSAAAAPVAGGSCCSTVPGFENGAIPTDEVAVAKVVGGVQEVTINVGSQGYSPAVAVVQKGLKTVIKFNTQSLNGCNSTIVFPELNGTLELSNGETKTPILEPTADFTFECGMSMLHGYVKVVDDINKIDLDAIRAEVEASTPASGSDGGAAGCCG